MEMPMYEILAYKELLAYCIRWNIDESIICQNIKENILAE